MRNVFESIVGSYSGAGRWRDDVGETHAYHVTLTIERRGEDLGIRFRHEFPEEDGQDDIQFDATMSLVAPGLLTFDLGGLRCRGYCAPGLVSYQIPLPGNLVEATFVIDGDSCRVGGSSEKNAAGHHIMWSECLTRTV